MVAIETVTGRVVNPGAAFAALTANTDQSFAVRFHQNPGSAILEELWAQQGTAGQVRVNSPNMHDDVVGIRMVSNANAVRRLLAEEAREILMPQDTIEVAMTGDAAATNTVAMLIYYGDLPGTAARLRTWEEVQPQIEHLYAFPVAVAGPVTAGDWSAGVAVNFTVDEMKANRDYAILGYTLDTECCAVAIAGSDTGNLKYGGPGPLLADETRAFFIDQGRRSGTPHIPIINSANRGGTRVFVCKNTAAGTVTVSLLTALLRG
jgi:hypothetical protein